VPHGQELNVRIAGSAARRSVGDSLIPDAEPVTGCASDDGTSTDRLAAGANPRREHADAHGDGRSRDRTVTL